MASLAKGLEPAYSAPKEEEAGPRGLKAQAGGSTARGQVHTGWAQGVKAPMGMTARAGARWVGAQVANQAVANSPGPMAARASGKAVDPKGVAMRAVWTGLVVV